MSSPDPATRSPGPTTHGVYPRSGWAGGAGGRAPSNEPEGL